MTVTVIAKRLEEIGLTQTELCRRADMHATNVSRIVRGSTKVGPSVRARTAAALGLPEDELFDGGWPKLASVA